MKTTTVVESQVLRTNVEVEQVPLRYNRKRNYMSTSFVSAQFQNNQYGCYQIMIDNHDCRPQCQPPPQQPYMMPMYVPVPYPQQQQKECECEDGESYKEELLFLRQRVAELLAREPEVKTVKERVEVIDNTRVEQLELEAQKLRLQLQQAQNQLRQKEQEFIELRSGNDQSQQGLSSRIRIIEEQLYNVRLEIERITGLLNQKEQEIVDWEKRCHEIESSVTYEIEEKTTKLRSEVEVWKSRFKKLNTDYFNYQEQLIMVQAEIDSIKNGGVKEVKEVKVEKKVVGPTITTVQSSQSRTRGSRVIESQEVYKEGTPARLYP
ncbi:unnamed protein product (macronuclear) [Paramecium tetraurelia]|uniref:Uncharacterized protein n=1 Tax=Paramecium tetraurelia TaxID=5888 RepID=A0BCQ8_PARTE|nr:uncharacterized protein GSPATT00004419001 [Paramecium tetraurelia]CAK56325.1 unnamed protein product [Paramecium tetraurelia]|eukprot:XP_001423723.1 hypothetical protein (macronuclear) [Paramecium tetraurelia strain d4-2]